MSPIDDRNYEMEKFELKMSVKSRDMNILYLRKKYDD